MDSIHTSGKDCSGGLDWNSAAVNLQASRARSCGVIAQRGIGRLMVGAFGRQLRRNSNTAHPRPLNPALRDRQPGAGAADMLKRETVEF